jgi:hypothetical protein
MDYVTAFINLGGDAQNVMYRGADRPVSWPEVIVLQFLHGEDSVYNCEFVSSEPTTPQREKQRLTAIYGAEHVNNLYPGARPLMEMDFPGDKAPAGQQRPPKIMAPTRDTREREEADRLENEESVDIPPIPVSSRRR